MKLSLTVNGTPREISVHPLKRLLDILREDLRLFGTKEGCGEGECGACAVLIDGALADSCMVPAMHLPGREVLTIEGLGTSSAPDALQRAFAEEGAVQCGFCIPGMIMASRALLAKRPRPDREEIRAGLSGNLCRCTGYEKIFRAVERAASEGYGEQLRRPAGEVPFSPPLFEEDEKDIYFQPGTLGEAMALRKRFGNGITILAGTTDFFPDLRNGKTVPRRILDLSRIVELRRISGGAAEIGIGALVTDAELMECTLVAEHFPCLARAAELSGAPAIRNRATLGGNLASASGAADLPVPLLALGASVLTAGERGARRIPLEEFFTGHRHTAMEEDEILAGVVIPAAHEPLFQCFYRRGSRAALTLSRASVSCTAAVSGGRIRRIRIAAGSMSEHPVRLQETERFLEGALLSPEMADLAAAKTSEEVAPRKSGAYRKAVAGNFVGKFLLSLLKVGN